MSQGFAHDNGVVVTKYGDRTVYDATYIFTADAAATDIFTITGSTKRCNILHASVTGIQTTASVIKAVLLKRSTANTGGTATTVTSVPIDSDNAAATATVRAYTANPTTGTLVGIIQYDYLFTPDNATNKGSGVSGFLTNERNGIPCAVLHNGEVIAINLDGQTVSGNSFACHIRWEEVV